MSPQLDALKHRDRIRLCAHADVPEGCARGFDPENKGADTIFLVRKSGRIYAWENACPHYANGARMNWKKDAFLSADGSRIMCSAHGALFEITSGVCELGPCLGKRLAPVRLTIGTHDIFYHLSGPDEGCPPEKPIHLGRHADD